MQQPYPQPALSAPAALVPDLASMPPLVKFNSAGAVGFFVLAGLCTTNINFITRAFFGTEQVFSIFYLMACLTVLFAFGFKMSASMGAPGRLWLLATALFLLVSTRAGLGIEKAYFLSPQSNFYRIIVAQVITICCAIGARHMMLRGQMQNTLRVLFAFTVFASLTIILVKQFPEILRFVGEGSQGRASGFFSDANRAGQAVCMTAALGFACLVGEKTRFRLVIYLGLLSLVPCLLLTYSRSSIVFMAILVLMQFFISPIFKRKEMIVGMLVLMIAIPIGISVLLNRRASIVNAKEAADQARQTSRLESLFDLLQGKIDESNTGHRFVVASVGLKYFYRSPIIGAGFRKLTRMPEIGLGCHNTFLRIFGEAGLFVGIIFMASIFYIVWCGWWCPQPEVKCLVIGFMAMYSCACMVSHMLLTNRLANVLMGVCLGFLSAALTLRHHQKKQARMAKMASLQQHAAPVTAKRPEVAVASS